MDEWTKARVAWVAAMLVLVPVCAFFWLVGGGAFCGEEVYDTPPGSVGDSLCNALVEPVVPWAAIAAAPFGLAAAAGRVAIRRRDRRLLLVALIAPFVLVAAAVVGLLAAF